VVYGADSWVTQIPLETFQSVGLTRVQVHVLDNAGERVFIVVHNIVGTKTIFCLFPRQEKMTLWFSSENSSLRVFI
jgi:hypothetical protein